MNPYWVDAVVRWPSDSSTPLVAGWPFRCIAENGTTKDSQALVLRLVVNGVVALVSSYALSRYAVEAIFCCNWRLNKRGAVALIAMLCSAFFLRDISRFSRFTTWEVIYSTHDLLHGVAWFSAISGVYWCLSQLVAVVKQRGKVKDGQFSLAMALVSMTLVCLLFAIANKLGRVYREQVFAEDFFRTHKVEFSYENEDEYSLYLARLKPLPGRAWRDWEAESGVSRYLLANPHGLYRPVKMFHAFEEDAPVDWSRLQFLPYLQIVRCRKNAKVSRELLEALDRCEYLETLDLAESQVDDEALKGLSPDLIVRELNLRFTLISDDGIDSILKMKSLRHLDVSESYISDAGLKRLRVGLPDCEVVCER
ncbi:MAG: hypothetical protein ACO1RA_21570 [Planctomycetaceae bacterium]